MSARESVREWKRLVQFWREVYHGGPVQTRNFTYRGHLPEREKEREKERRREKERGRERNALWLVLVPTPAEIS